MAKVKYDWYQTETAVTVTVLLKNAAEKNYSVQLEQNSLRLQADDIEPIVLSLWNPINTEQSSHKATPSKVEIKLAKMIGHRWDALERQQQAHEQPSTAVAPAKQKHDWDKISKEIEKDDPEKDDVSQLFKKIFADANEDTKKAMMKSYYESGGTVLSTNWAEVGAKQVEVQPPDGCEYKKWN
ncbi:protein SGT1 homolog [Anopheles bellator]|uniref:protein SGT1 homolog n=1 Tax=Anopheles bellator TaxID=139047 RepID=UPI0026496D46|nr:protein SGT1 homolog [Anopheles bellator]